MRTLSFEEAKQFLSSYPLVRNALDADGIPHADRLSSRIPDPEVVKRLKLGMISPEEDKPPLGPLSLGEFEKARDDGRLDDAKFVAAAFVYVTKKPAQAA